ncbi:TTLL4.2 family protein [Megaselia abdita]
MSSYYRDRNDNFNQKYRRKPSISNSYFHAPRSASANSISSFADKRNNNFHYSEAPPSQDFFNSSISRRSSVNNNREYFYSNQSPSTAFPPISTQYRGTENSKYSTESLQRNDRMSGMKLKYVSNSHRTSTNNNPILREKMPENDLNQPFEDFFYEKLKASEENPTSKKKTDIPNEVNKSTTLPTPPPLKNKTPSTTSARTKTKPISSLKCNLTNGNSKSKSTISSSSSKSSSGKVNVPKKSWSTSSHSESRHVASSAKQKQPETTKKIVCLNDSDDGDNDDDDYDNSVEDDDDFVEEPDGSLISTSESEDGYKDYAVKLITEKAPSPALIATKSLNAKDQPKSSDSFLVPSLFPNVPSYLSFSSNLVKGPDVPHEIFKVLKFRVTSVMPKVVRIILTNSGMRLLKKTNDWIGVWGKHLKSPCFKTIRPYQKINHLPGSFKIGRKDSCWKNLQKQMSRHGKNEFGFMPKTYILPQDLTTLRKYWPKYSQKNFKWIIKPPASARGTGIKVVNRWAQIPKRKPIIVQKYIERPLLINGSKFDLRLYVLVTSINPLRVYMYHNGLVRFASVKYSSKNDTLNDRCMHLTNYSINKFSSNYSKNEDVNACHGHKWTLKSLWTYLESRHVDTSRLWGAMRNLVLKTILAGENSIYNMIKLNVESKYSTFELFGFDVLLDSDLVPWLLEVNISPSLHSDLPLDAHVKAPLVQAVFNTALYNVPPKFSQERQKEILAKHGLKGPLCYDYRMYVNYLSRDEKIKHTKFTRKCLEDRDEYLSEILEDLTPDDIRCLIIAEDELERSNPLERIFPTTSSFKYLKYTEVPRYYNRLLDAWEHKYGRNRSAGIKLLKQYCADKVHLNVPTSPVKKVITNYYIVK